MIKANHSLSHTKYEILYSTISLLKFNSNLMVDFKHTKPIVSFYICTEILIFMYLRVPIEYSYSMYLE